MKSWPFALVILSNGINHVKSNRNLSSGFSSSVASLITSATFLTFPCSQVSAVERGDAECTLASSSPIAEVQPPRYAFKSGFRDCQTTTSYFFLSSKIAAVFSVHGSSGEAGD